MKRLQRMKMDSGMFSVFSLLLALKKQEEFSLIGIPPDPLGALRLVSMAVHSGYSHYWIGHQCCRTICGWIWLAG